MIIAYLRQAQKHCELVKRVFGGKMINVIICRECSTVSLLRPVLCGIMQKLHSLKQVDFLTINIVAVTLVSFTITHSA